MKPLDTKKDYQNYVDKKSPNSPIFKNCFNAFWVGGLICSIGQIIMDFCKFRGLDKTLSSTIVSIILIFISAFLTGLNLFNKLVNLLVQVLLFQLLVLQIQLYLQQWNINLKAM